MKPSPGLIIGSFAHVVHAKESQLPSPVTLLTAFTRPRTEAPFYRADESFSDVDSPVVKFQG